MEGENVHSPCHTVVVGDVDEVCVEGGDQYSVGPLLLHPVDQLPSQKKIRRAAYPH